VLELVRDPFGFYSLFYAVDGDTVYFSTEIQQLLALPWVCRDIDYTAIHHYLTFSFIPGDRTPVQSIRQVPPGTMLRWKERSVEVSRYVVPKHEHPFEKQALELGEDSIIKGMEAAVDRCLDGRQDVALALSGGLDSSIIGAVLKSRGARVKAFTLDFGRYSVEKDEAKSVATQLGLPLVSIKVRPGMLRKVIDDFIGGMGLPFGDAAVAGQYFLNKAIGSHRLSTVFNGEGGDQLFGGWTQKPMLSAAVYAPGLDINTRYLNCYHRFQGLEDEMYTNSFKEKLHEDDRSQIIARSHEEVESISYLDRIRLIDFHLKGTQSIAPRAHRMAEAWGLELETPFFDREFVKLSFTVPSRLKLSGACEKYILKKQVAHLLPEDIIWRRKKGMSFPVTQWLLKPFGPVAMGFFSLGSLLNRGYFKEQYINRLLRGDDHASEIRQRRLGEKLWTLIVLDAWFRQYLDR
jgi:asparagine synthase (glutamine-hydrolysing)